MNKIKKGLNILRYEGLGIFLKKSYSFFVSKLKYVFSIFVSPFVLFFLKRNEKDIKRDHKNSIDYVYRAFNGYFRPAQIREEITELTKILEEKKPEAILEIGTSGGGTFFVLSKLLSDDGVIISIDMPGGSFGGDGYKPFNKYIYKQFTKKETHLLRRDSHDLKTKEELVKVLDGKGLDVLFIDGDHTYDGVKKDYKLYSPLVKKGGIIAFHDIAHHGKVVSCRVDEFWDEIKQGKNYKEIIKDINQGWAGIGIIFT